MNDQAVEALREAMEPPTWWTNRARLSAREVLERLQARGYQLTPVAAAGGAPAEGATNPGQESTAGVHRATPMAASSPGVVLGDDPGLRAAEEAAATEAAVESGGSPAPLDRARGSLGRLMTQLESRVSGVQAGEPTPETQAEEERRKSA